MYSVIVGRPTFWATCAKTVLTEYLSASDSVIWPKDWLRSFCSGTPEIVTGELPLIIEFGVYLPLSIAAVAVTTLKVEPGGPGAPWVASLNRLQPGVLRHTVSDWLSS